LAAPESAASSAALTGAALAGMFALATLGLVGGDGPEFWLKMGNNPEGPSDGDRDDV